MNKRDAKTLALKIASETLTASLMADDIERALDCNDDTEGCRGDCPKCQNARKVKKEVEILARGLLNRHHNMKGNP